MEETKKDDSDNGIKLLKALSPGRENGEEGGEGDQEASPEQEAEEESDEDDYDEDDEDDDDEEEEESEEEMEEVAVFRDGVTRIIKRVIGRKQPEKKIRTKKIKIAKKNTKEIDEEGDQNAQDENIDLEDDEEDEEDEEENENEAENDIENEDENKDEDENASPKENEGDEAKEGGPVRRRRPKKPMKESDSDEEVEKDDSQDEDYEPIDRSPVKARRGVTRASKKRIADGLEVPTKEDDIDEEDDEGDEDQDDDEGGDEDGEGDEEGDGEDDEEGSPSERKKKKAKAKAKAPRKKREPKQPREKRAKGEKRVKGEKKPKAEKKGKGKKEVIYKKGKINPNVDVVKHYDFLENKSDQPIDYGCVKANNKNLHRAIYTDNYTLLENSLTKNNFFSTLHQHWAPENDVTAVKMAIRKKDLKALKMILEAEYDRKIRFTTEPRVALQYQSTGNVSKAAFGVEIRKVNIMRGGREGNNAFTHDLDAGANYLDLNDLFDSPIEKEILEYLRLKAGANQVFAKIDKLVLRGDRVNAAHLINLANASGGYGFNFLYEEALLKEKAEELSANIKKVSVTKKTTGNSSITPLHCAAINPNTEILEALLKISPEYSIQDENMRKLVHYAAACEGTGPLEHLISLGCDPREKDKAGLTPFMYACFYGKDANAEFLIKEAKVDPLYKTKDGMMGVHWAAQNGHLNVLKMLARNGSKLSEKGGKAKMTLLHFVAAYGYLDCVEFLIEKKAKVLAKDKMRRTPLTMAVRNGNLKIASLLLKL